MLEIRKKHVNASMFQLPDQEMVISLGEGPPLEQGTSGIAPLSLNDDYVGMGVILSPGEATIGIVIDKPALEVDENTFNGLRNAGVDLSGAYNIAVLDIYDKLAKGVAKDLFTKPNEPTFRIQYGMAQKGERRPVEKVEIVMKGQPTGHPFWSLEKF